jgi:hypothetical protein
VHTGRDHLEVAFEFRKMRFVYNEATNCFARLKFPVHEPFEYYLKATGGCGRCWWCSWLLHGWGVCCVADGCTENGTHE